MKTADYEPAAGFNMPAGCFDVPDVPEPRECGECEHFKEISDNGCGVCKKRFYEFIDSDYYAASRFKGLASLDFICENAICEGTEACGSFEEYGTVSHGR